MRMALKIGILTLLMWPLMVHSAGLYLFGGGKRPEIALQKFVSETKDQVVGVITWSTAEPDLTFESLSIDLYRAGAKKVIALPHHITTQAELNEFKSVARSVTGIFFSGGSQERALNVIDDNHLRNFFEDLRAKGVVFGGTSAGTALMPKLAMTGDMRGGMPVVRNGLGFVDFLVDQHFIVRKREARLKALVTQTGIRGLGIDEDMAAIVRDSKIEVVGPTHVLTYVPNENGSIEKCQYAMGTDIVSF